MLQLNLNAQRYRNVALFSLRKTLTTNENWKLSLHDPLSFDGDSRQVIKVIAELLSREVVSTNPIGTALLIHIHKTSGHQPQSSQSAIANLN